MDWTVLMVHLIFWDQNVEFCIIFLKFFRTLIETVIIHHSEITLRLLEMFSVWFLHYTVLSVHSSVTVQTPLENYINNFHNTMKP